MTSRGFKLPKVPRRTTLAFGFSYVDRAFYDGLGLRKFGHAEQEKAVGFFSQFESQPACVFCGANTVARWDHLIPVMSGGQTVLGNMVLACSACDDSKAKTPFEQWMFSDSPKSPTGNKLRDLEERVERIQTYMETYHYEPIPLNDRLTVEESQQLAALRKELALLRSRAEGLVEDFRKRKGFR